MSDNLDNLKILEIMRDIKYYALLDLFKFYKYNDKSKLDSVKIFFNFVSKFTHKKFNNIYLIGERYESIVDDLIDNNDEKKSNKVFEIIEGMLILSESLDDMEYIVKKEDVDENRVKRLVERYNGIMDINVESINLETKKILVLDDDYEILQMMDLILPKYGYKTILTTNSKKVLSILNNNDIIMCIIDYNMPRKDGLEVLRDIRKEYPDLPVIFYTANTEKEVKDKAINMGKSLFISKPASEKVLIEAVKRALRNSNETIENIENDKKEKFKVKSIFKKSKESVDNKNNKSNDKSASKILFVDNEKLVIKLIKSKFEMENINVDFTDNLKEAFKLSVMNEYLLIILDFNIKGENAFEFINNIKQNNITSKAKIIVLSSDNSEQLKNEVYNMGIDELLLKPFSVRELLMKIQKLI